MHPMCGRYLSVSNVEQLSERFDIDEVRTDPLPERYNVAPSQDVYAVIEKDQRRRLGSLRWGFVPHWTERLRGARTPINARLEGIERSRMFGDSVARRRCLLPADGFYEWQDRGADERKQPYHLHDPEGRPLAFAGVWTAWRDPEGDGPLFSAAIVTRAAEGELTRIHERVPVILPATLWSDWLTTDRDDAPHLLEVVRALGPQPLVATPITDRVNSVQNEGAELLEPVDA